MKLYFEKAKCKITESLNGFFLEIETDDEVEFTGGNGHNYILFDEDEDGIGPAPDTPFVVEDHRYKRP